MPTRHILAFAAFVLLASNAAALAASGGVQWSPDKRRLLAQKDVGDQRWAITLNLDDLSVSGNVFFPNGSPPAFVFCDAQSVTHNIADLVITYRCRGSDQTQVVFDSQDWNLISDNIPLSGSFFAPTPGTCDLSGALNGSDASHVTSVWNCTGITPPDVVSFQLEVFADGTGVTSDGGSFEFSPGNGGCGFGLLPDGSSFSASYSPSRDVLNFLFVPAGFNRFNLSECHRQR
jgi:hypothetical protein